MVCRGMINLVVGGSPRGGNSVEELVGLGLVFPVLGQNALHGVMKVDFHARMISQFFAPSNENIRTDTGADAYE